MKNMRAGAADAEVRHCADELKIVGKHTDL
jgi:hypothetical protein